MKHRIVGILGAALMLLSMSAPALAAALPSPAAPAKEGGNN